MLYLSMNLRYALYILYMTNILIKLYNINTNITLETKYTLGPNIMTNPYSLGFYLNLQQYLTNCYDTLTNSRPFSAFMAAQWQSRWVQEQISKRDNKEGNELQSLLLKKPSANSKTEDQIDNLTKRLALWKEGKSNELISEGKVI